MSGTSVDGIDAVLVDFSSDTPRLLSSLNTPWPDAIRHAIFNTRQLADNALGNLQQLDMETATVFAQAVNELLQQAGIAAKDISAIGSHGQTIRHRPDAEPAFSLQIGNARHLAELTGIRVISDFRTADIEAGGQGAPLVPAFHQYVFSSTEKNRVVVNIGGIANITVLPKTSADSHIIGFDTGPGNSLMDAWITKHQHKKYDTDGKLAASGKTSAGLLAKLLMDEYFQLPPPKSTGFEYFNLDWFEQYLNLSSEQQITETGIANMQSTLCDLTVISIIQAINRHAGNTDEIFICGGGAHNTELMSRLQQLSRKTVSSTEVLGIHPDWVEAMTFAWLARQTVKNLPGNIPAVTGASRPVVLGHTTNA